MRLKISAITLFLFAVCLIPRASFATTVTLKLESTDSGIYPYAFSVNGSQTLTDLSCLNDDRDVNLGEIWTATATNLETLISNPSDLTGSGMTVSELEDDAFLDAQYITNPSAPDYTLNNIEVQDAIWSILDGHDVYTDLSHTDDSAVQSLVAAAEGSSETSAFYSQFTFYAPQTWNTWRDDDQSGGEPQQFLGYTPSPSVTPEPASLILLGTGIVGVAGAMRRRMKSALQA